MGGRGSGLHPPPSEKKIQNYRVSKQMWSGSPEKSQNIGFLSNTGLDPLKIVKLSSQYLMLDHHRSASEFGWRADDGP